MKRQFVRVPMWEAGCVLGSLCASPTGGWTASHEPYSFPEDGRPSKGSILLVTDFTDFNMHIHSLDILLGCRFLVCRSHQFFGDTHALVHTAGSTTASRYGSKLLGHPSRS